MRRAFTLMFLLSLLQGALAWAALAIPSDFSNTGRGTALRAAPVAGAPLYTVSQTKLASGTIVREYSDAAGAVFAVSWKGPALPNLRALLRDKFTGVTNRPEVMIVSNGNAHTHAGHAWIPAALPAGFEQDYD